MPRKVFRVRGMVVGVDTSGLDRAIKRLDKEGIEAAADIVEEAVRTQWNIARREWGVDTGRGRASVRILRTRVRDVFVVRIFSKYDRVRFQSFDGKRPTFWAVLVQRPLKKLQKRLAKDAAKAMAIASLGDQRRSRVIRRRLQGREGIKVLQRQVLRRKLSEDGGVSGLLGGGSE